MLRNRPKFKRHPENPIIRPGKYPWRQAVTFNPAVVYEEGVYTLYERTAGSLTPFQCSIGMLESRDGVHFEHAVDEPVFTPDMAGSEFGSVQDPRVVRIEGIYYMTFAFRPFAWSSYPTGVGVPRSEQVDYPGFDGDPSKNQTRSGIAVSRDRRLWNFHSWVSSTEIDDRNVILFPEKIGGRFAALRRPQGFVGTDTSHGTTIPSIQLSYSTDLRVWTEPVPILHPEFAWEDNRIGGSTPPLRTEAGWLVFYHGVQNLDASLKRVVYRMGACLLDLEDPTRVLARSPEPLLEPEEYYECFGVYIPKVVFPTGAVVVDGTIHLYYGVCDTAIAKATAELDAVMNYLDLNRA